MGLLIEDATKPKSNVVKKSVYILIAPILLVAVLLAVHTLYTKDSRVTFSNAPVPADSESITQVAVQKPFGLLLLSLVLGSLEDQRTALSPMLFDLDTKMLSAIPIIKNSGLDFETFQYSMSFDSKRVVFLGLPLTSELTSSLSAEDDGESWSIFRSNIGNTKEYAEIENILNSATSTEVFEPSSEDYFRQLPAISNDGSIVYSALKKEQYDASKERIGTISADEWTVYLIGKHGSKTKLVQGLKPKWINSGIFAYLKNDGVHVYNTKTYTDALLVQTDEVMTSVNGIDVSSKEKYLALTTPENGKVTIIPLSEWLNEKKTLATIVSVNASNPIFSPDNKFLAMVVLEEDKNSSESDSTANLKFFSLESLQFLPDPLEFGDEVVQGIYLTDWQ